MTRIARPALTVLLLGLLILARAAPAQQADDGAAAQHGGDDQRLAAVPLVPPDQAELQALQRVDAPVPDVAISAGINLVTHYVSRGQVYASRGSFQPWIEVDLPLQKDGPGLIGRIDAFVGNWNSFQAGDPGLGQPRTGNRRVVDNWYEADIYGGVRVGLGERWLASLRFNYYTSPSDSFRDIHEIDFRLSYDDGPWWAQRGLSRFSMKPSIRVAKETRDAGGPEQWYISPALRPTCTLDLAGRPVSLTIPLVLGFGVNGQYIGSDGDEKHLGFFQTGLTVAVPLEVLPDSAGRFSISAGFDAIFVSDEAINFRDRNTEIVGKLGLSYSY